VSYATIAVPLAFITGFFMNAINDSTTAELPTADDLRARILEKLAGELGRTPDDANHRDWFVAVALALRDRIAAAWVAANARADAERVKRVYYLSAEFLVGRLFGDAIGNLDIDALLHDALAPLGVDLDAIRVTEPDAALGNGGLGRLAACFMDSMATLAIPAFGYGIRYDYGLFRQEIIDGVQHEAPDDWLAQANPWEFARPELARPVGFGGTVAVSRDAVGIAHYAWHPGEIVTAVPYDTPVIGAGGRHANTLRLWSARAAQPLDLAAFNAGHHVGAMRERVRIEAISRVLYPGDSTDSGQELRLRQEFFFASASLQDLLARHIALYGDPYTLAEYAAIQLNDTHPAIAVAELMRLLIDDHQIGWSDAWRITVGTIAYTNHTLLPEALESWSITLLERLLPRHMQIIYLLNAQHMDHVRAHHGHTGEELAALSMIDESHGRRVRMGHLAFIGSHAINGVSALHTQLMGHTVFGALDRLYGGRIRNKTNGITFRRWLHHANPGLTRVLVEALGARVRADPDCLIELAGRADDPALQAAFAAQRRLRKQSLAGLIAERTGIAVDPAAMFDVQIKRMHEYKRQLLNILQTVAQYQAICADPHADWVPRVKLFAGKAAPGYRVAKQIIRLAHDVAKIINADPLVADRLKLVFLPNYGVSLAEQIIPAADLSEQISTAGMEASGTGNMKLALNGALTIGTLDGANVEISERVGRDNIFIFGLTAEEVAARRRDGHGPAEAIAASPALKQALSRIGAGAFSPDDPDRYGDLVHALGVDDQFMVTADFDAYATAQVAVDDLWCHPSAWWRAAIRNTAAMSWFSSDRTIAEYAADIWHVTSL
jgi:starch phosphorylase